MQNIKSKKEKFWRESLLLAEDNKKKLQKGGSVGLQKAKMGGLFLEWNEQSLKNTYMNKSKIKEEYGSIKPEHRIAGAGGGGGGVE